MNKIIITTISVFIFLYGLISCEQTLDSTENNLIGTWQITKIDSLVQFITPVKPDTIITWDCKICILKINDDNSFRMINPTDTLTGNWNQSASDTLSLSINSIQGNFLYKQNLKIDNITSNDLTLISFGGYVSGGLFVGHSGFSVTEEIKYKIVMHYDKIQ